jgi:hypothetical protein
LTVSTGHAAAGVQYENEPMWARVGLERKKLDRLSVKLGFKVSDGDILDREILGVTD